MTVTVTVTPFSVAFATWSLVLFLRSAVTVTVTLTVTLKSARGLRAFDTSSLCWVCAGMLGERGLGLVVHIPSGCVAKINIPRP